jgi:hypothetical protein
VQISVVSFNAYSVQLKIHRIATRLVVYAMLLSIHVKAETHLSETAVLKVALLAHSVASQCSAMLPVHALTQVVNVMVLQPCALMANVLRCWIPLVECLAAVAAESQRFLVYQRAARVFPAYVAVTQPMAIMTVLVV